MTCYRIYTENKLELPNLVKWYFNNFTIIHALGFWRVGNESTCIVEIIGTDRDIDTVESLAKAIKTVNKQEAVLVTQHEIESNLI